MTRRDDPAHDDHAQATLASRPSSRGSPSTPTASETRSRRPSREGNRSDLRARSARQARHQALNEVLLAEEATRARGFATVLIPVSLCMTATLPLMGGDRVARWVCAGALLSIALASALVRRVTRPDAGKLRTDPKVYRAYAVLLLVGVIAAEYYLGFYSPVPVVLVFGAYYFGQAHDPIQSKWLTGAVIVSYAGFGSLIAFGVIEDRGLFQAGYIAIEVRLIALVAVCAILFGTLHLARVARRSLHEAIERSNEALLVAQRREAQLAEAHFQLDHALALGVGKPGRYTGQLAGEYELGVLVGIGAIGEIYEGISQGDGSRAAVKLLQAAAQFREDLISRILREGEIARDLRSPYLVRVLDAGRLEDGAPYLAMELLEGRDLAARLRQDGQLRLEDVVELAEQMGAGLQHAHAAGIIHRDLKPLNIFEASERGKRCWKILDFGISKLTTSSGTLTQEGVVGTPGYMSPEQARGAGVDGRSDLFSMAVVLYRAVTGQPAFPGDNTPQIMFDVVYKMPQQPSVVQRGLPADVDLVMAIALAKSPDDRFQSAEALAQAFALAARGELGSAERERGRALAQVFPWGTSLAGRNEKGG